MFTKNTCLILLLILTAFPPLSVSAMHTPEGTPLSALQSSNCTPISYGETVYGNITLKNYAITYCFYGDGGDTITINMMATSGDLDGYLALMNANTEDVLIEVDDVYGMDPAIEYYSLPYDGQYMIVATRYDLNAGSSTGSFELSLNAESAPPMSNLSGGMNVTCDNGPDIMNGVEIIVVQMRSGFTYKATVLGLYGFDPVLAVLDSYGDGLCNDDEFTASNYSVSLPTTGAISGTSASAQINFSQNSNTSFDDVSLVVGSYSGEGGEFVLILEGMAVTSADNMGDPFAVPLTAPLINYGLPVTVYMIGEVRSLDPYISALDGTMDYYLYDDFNVLIDCDDAGSLCWGNSQNMEGYYVYGRRRQRIYSDERDAMLSLPLNNNRLDRVTFVMSSYSQSTTGDYTLIFHMGMR